MVAAKNQLQFRRNMRFTLAEIKQLKDDWAKSTFNSYKGFADQYHSRYGRSASSILVALSKLGTKNQLKKNKEPQTDLFAQPSKQEEQKQVEANVSQVKETPVSENKTVTPENNKQSRIVVESENITISINSDISATIDIKANKIEMYKGKMIVYTQE